MKVEMQRSKMARIIDDRLNSTRGLKPDHVVLPGSKLNWLCSFLRVQLLNTRSQLLLCVLGTGSVGGELDISGELLGLALLV